MTSVTGYYLKATPCCGVHYSTPRFRSLNFSAFVYWTDGYKEGALMPDGHGLRQCKCGNFFLLRELVTIQEGNSADSPSPKYLAPEDLPRAIAQARNTEVELAARLDYWQHLNHDFREHYRAYRETEESVMQASWETVNPDQRTWWQRYRKAKRIPTYVPSPKRLITYPAFEPTETQCENMNSLLGLMTCADYPNAYTFEVAELYRELGRFAEAKAVITQYPEHDIGVREKLLERLINDGQSAPVRYRI